MRKQKNLNWIWAFICLWTLCL